MQETIDLALRYIRMLWRFRWVALLTATAVCLGGWAFVVTLPDEYQVETKVYLDSRSLLQPVLRGLALDANMQRDTAMLMRQTLLVRPNLEAVARKTDLDLEAKTPGEFERLLDDLASRIAISGTTRDNIFNIRYRDEDPEFATRVVEALLNLFVEKSLGDSRKDTNTTRQFIEKQIAEYEARLAAAEERLKEFKRRNVGLMPGSGGNYYARLETTEENLAQAKLAHEEAMKRRDEIRQQLEDVDRMLVLEPGEKPGQGSAPPSAEALRVQNLQGQLDQLLVKYTEKHPDVSATRRLLEEARADVEAVEAAEAAEAEAEAEAAGEDGAKSRNQVENPMYQQLTIQLGQAEGEVAALATRVVEYERRAEELRNLVDTVPRVEAEFARLNRDYSVVKQNYDELLKRREQLKIGEDADQSADGFQFNILEPPRVPLVPVAPDRPRLSAGVLGAGFGAGIGFAVLIALLRPTVYTRDELEALTGLPVLGSVSRLWTRRERWRRRMEVFSFAGGTLGLFGLFGGLLVLFTLNVDIVAKVTELGERFL